MQQLLAQLIGVVGSAFNIASFQMKRNRFLYLFQGLSSIAFTVNFFMLGSCTGAMLNMINIFRSGIFVLGSQGRKWYYFVAVEALYIVVTAVTFSGVLSLAVLAAQLIATVFMWMDNGRNIRIVQFFVVSPIWLVHNVMVGSIGGIICEGFNLISIVISVVRIGLNGFEK